jgi:hypothetical protein
LSSEGTGGGWDFTPRARRDMRRLDRPVQRRIIEALDRFVGDPPVGDVVKLAGADDEYRRRQRVGQPRDSGAWQRVGCSAPSTR